MKRKTALPAALIICAAMLCSCGGPESFSGGEILSDSKQRTAGAAETYNYSDGATRAPASYNSYANTVEELSLRLLRSRYEEQSDSPFVFAPSGASLMLSELVNGASSDTRSELLVGFGGSLSADDLNQCSSYYKSRLEAVSQLGKKKDDDSDPFDSEHISLSQNLFVQKDGEITSAFLQKNADFYGSKIIRSDFAAESFAAKQQTLFEKYVPNASVGADKKSSMYSVCAADMADIWLNTYSADSLSSGKFHGAKGDTDASFMTSDEHYLSTDNLEGIVKYTSKNPLKLVAVKPKGKASLKDCIANLNSTEYNNLIDSMKATTTVQAKLPQFSVDSGSKAKPLSEKLKNAGFRTLFDKASSFKSMNISGTLRLDEMYELEPSLTVAAHGIKTEATANPGNDQASLLKNNKAQKPTSEKTVTFDKPFIFLLIDNESSIPVMMGVYQ